MKKENQRSERPEASCRTILRMNNLGCGAGRRAADDTAGYGYFFWIADEPDTFYASGSGGQMICCFRTSGTVVALTSHPEPVYQYRQLLDPVRAHIL